MQVVPVESMLEMSAIYAGVFFSLIAIVAVYHYAEDIRFRRWAISMVLFWIAYLPQNIFIGFTYLGYFISSVLRVYASFMVLRAFGYKPLRKISDLRLLPAIFVLLGIYWLPIWLLQLPNASGEILTSTLMVIAFFYAGNEIFHFPFNLTKEWISAGASYLFWAISSIPMIFLPFFADLILASYLQFVGQCLVLVTMFLTFFGGITRNLERNLNLTEMTGSLITHDLRNYLNVTNNALDLIDAKDTESQNMLQLAKETIKDASDFISEVRLMFIELGKHSSSMEDVDLTKMVEKIIRRAKQEHNLTDSQLYLTTNEPVIVCTSPLVAQVIWNIIDNGIRHTTDPPEVILNLEPLSNVVLSISDRSGGMSDKLKERVLHSEKDGRGIGLGLMLIREISNICRINLKIEDNIENGSLIGTTYHLEFPSAGGLPTS